MMRRAVLAGLLLHLAEPVSCFSAANPHCTLWKGLQEYRYRHATTLRVASLRGGFKSKSDAPGNPVPSMSSQISQQPEENQQVGLRLPVSKPVLFVSTAIFSYIMIILHAKIGIAKFFEKGFFEPFLKNVSLMDRFFLSSSSLPLSRDTLATVCFVPLSGKMCFTATGCIASNLWGSHGFANKKIFSVNNPGKSSPRAQHFLRWTAPKNTTT
jgi:hypothetical protein